MARRDGSRGFKVIWWVEKKAKENPVFLGKKSSSGERGERPNFFRGASREDEKSEHGTFREVRRNAAERKDC